MPSAELGLTARVETGVGLTLSCFLVAEALELIALDAVVGRSYRALSLVIERPRRIFTSRFPRYRQTPFDIRTVEILPAQKRHLSDVSPTSLWMPALAIDRNCVMRKTFQNDCPKPVVCLAGDIDIYTAPTVCRGLDVITGPAIIDLSRVSHFSAAALRELAIVAARVGPRQVSIIGTSAHVRRVLKLVRFDELFEIIEQ